MEIGTQIFTKYLVNNEKNSFYLDDFFSSHKEFHQILMEYERISYTDNVTKFFFLFQNREYLNEKFDDFLKSKRIHLHSVVRFIFLSERFPSTISFFEYDLNKTEDVIEYLNIFFLFELFIILSRIILQNNLYYDENYQIKPLPLVGKPFIINNQELLKISPFIFESIEFEKLFFDDLQSIKIVDASDEDVFILRRNLYMKIGEIAGEIESRTKIPYIKNFSPALIKRSIGFPNDKVGLNIKSFFQSYGREGFFNKFIINTDFTFGALITLNLVDKVPILFDRKEPFGFTFLDMEEKFLSTLVGTNNAEAKLWNKIKDKDNNYEFRRGFVILMNKNELIKFFDSFIKIFLTQDFSIKKSLIHQVIKGNLEKQNLQKTKFREFAEYLFSSSERNVKLPDFALSKEELKNLIFIIFAYRDKIFKFSISKEKLIQYLQKITYNNDLPYTTFEKSNTALKRESKLKTIDREIPNKYKIYNKIN